MKVDKEQGLIENQNFYGNLYRRNSPIVHLLRTIISFDQQSKARNNSRILHSYLTAMSSKRGSSNVSLLDFGSGWGAFLLKMPRTFNLYCFDLSDLAMKRLEKVGKYLNYKIFPAIVHDTHITKPESIDVIVCSHVLEHVEDDIKILRMFYNVLNEEGMVLLNVPINEIWNDPKHLRSYTSSTLSSAAQEVGFKIVEIAEADKWTGFLLEKEMVDDNTLMHKIYYRSLRALLAILPEAISLLSEKIFFKDRENTQLMIVLEKNNS